jgi:hypothetical protein
MVKNKRRFHSRTVKNGTIPTFPMPYRTSKQNNLQSAWRHKASPMTPTRRSLSKGYLPLTSATFILLFIFFFCCVLYFQFFLSSVVRSSSFLCAQPTAVACKSLSFCSCSTYHGSANNWIVYKKETQILPYDNRIMTMTAIMVAEAQLRFHTFLPLS